ncbi:MAG: hypothetical protein Q9160_003423 [Pyrenula sp. 1 TL-2023]
MEYLPLGDIATCFKEPLPEPVVKAIGVQVLEGLAKMHEMGFTHRDIKPQNILVVQKSPIWVKIGDFGVSKRIQADDTALRTMVGTRQFAAPEIFGMLEDAPQSSEYTNMVDIWSLGCMLHYLLTRHLPFPPNLYKYCTRPTPFPSERLKHEQVTAAGISFIQLLIAPQPSQRPSASIALTSPWIQNQISMEKHDTETGIMLQSRVYLDDSVAQLSDRAHDLDGFEVADGRIDIQLAANAILENVPEPSRSPSFKPHKEAEQESSQAMRRLGPPSEDDRDKAANLLLRNGWDINRPNSHYRGRKGYEALLWATARGNEAAVWLLLEKGVNATSRNKEAREKMALHTATQNGFEPIVQLMLEKGASITRRDNRQSTVLHIAAAEGHERLAKLFLNAGADIDAGDCEGDTALMLAVCSGREAVVRILLERGAQINLANLYGFAPLHKAMTRGETKSDLIHLLLVNGADIDTRSSHGYAALHIATNNGYHSTVLLLLEHGADINAISENGDTALHLAARRGFKSLVAFLLEKGADANARTIVGQTAVDLATEAHRKDIVSLLGTYQSNPNSKQTKAKRVSSQPRLNALRMLLTKNETRLKPEWARMRIKSVSAIEELFRGSSPQAEPKVR